MRMHDPLAALAELHRLHDAGGEGVETALLESSLLLDLGCGTFAAAVADRAICRYGASIDLELLRLRGHMAAFASKQAIPIAKDLLGRPGLSPHIRHELAKAAHELGLFALAEAEYARLLDQNGGEVATYVNMGHINQKLGRMDAAEACFRDALALQPYSGHGIRLLAYVRKHRDADDIVSRVKAALPHLPLDSEDAAAAYFAMGKVLEDSEDYPQAFEAFSAGNRIMRSLAPYTHAASEAAFALTRRYFDHRPLAISTPVWNPEPLFIVGLPRTGSTLLDRMLGCHPDVATMGELGNFKEAMKVVTGYAGGAGFHAHFYAQPDRPVDIHAIGDLYRANAAPDGFAGKWFTDKYHMNFLDLGLIAEALPNAKFIHTVRDPLDTVFANFKQMFSLGFHHFSYDLEECARYYLCYRKLMDDWCERLPDRILNVHYADLVRDPAGTLRQVKTFLGLSWQDACLAPERNATPVDTASLAQVRQPIYTTALGHAQRYGAALDPARTVLGCP